MEKRQEIDKLIHMYVNRILEDECNFMQVDSDWLDLLIRNKYYNTREPNICTNHFFVPNCTSHLSRHPVSSFQVVFGSLVPGLEKDRDWTGLGPARTGNHRTAQDRNRSPVCGPLPF